MEGMFEGRLDEEGSCFLQDLHDRRAGWKDFMMPEQKEDWRFRDGDARTELLKLPRASESHGPLLKCTYWFCRLCISDKLSGNADEAGLWSTLWVAVFQLWRRRVLRAPKKPANQKIVDGKFCCS